MKVTGGDAAGVAGVAPVPVRRSVVVVCAVDVVSTTSSVNTVSKMTEGVYTGTVVKTVTVVVGGGGTSVAAATGAAEPAAVPPPLRTTQASTTHVETAPPNNSARGLDAACPSTPISTPAPNDRLGGSGGQSSPARGGLRQRCRELLTHPTVDPFPQQVRVPVVPRVLLDHVHQKLTQRDGVA